MGILRDLKNNLDLVQSIAPAARTASVNGASANLQDYGSAMAVIDIGAWTDGSFTPKLQESDDDATFTDVASADLEGSFSAVDGAADDDTTQRVGYKGTKTYVRVVLTEAGASPAPSTGCVIGALVVRGNPHVAPLA